MRVDRFDIHQHITDQIVNAIERGAGEFQLPWHRSAGSIMRPVNIASKKAYRGVNVVALWAYAEKFGYSSGVWGTYRHFRCDDPRKVRMHRERYFLACLARYTPYMAVANGILL
jgi:antirestriction protein ArdC